MGIMQDNLCHPYILSISDTIANVIAREIGAKR